MAFGGILAEQGPALVEVGGAGFENDRASVEVDGFAHTAAHVIVGEFYMGVVEGGVWHAAGHGGEAVFSVVGVIPEAVLREVSVKVILEDFLGGAGEGVVGVGGGCVVCGGAGDGDALQVRGVGGVFRLGFVKVAVCPRGGGKGRAADGDLRAGGAVGDAADGEPGGGLALGVLVEFVGGVGVGCVVEDFLCAVADGVEGVTERAPRERGAAHGGLGGGEFVAVVVGVGGFLREESLVFL